MMQDLIADVIVGAREAIKNGTVPKDFENFTPTPRIVDVLFEHDSYDLAWNRHLGFFVIRCLDDCVELIASEQGEAAYRCRPVEKIMEDWFPDVDEVSELVRLRELEERTQVLARAIRAMGVHGKQYDAEIIPNSFDETSTYDPFAGAKVSKCYVVHRTFMSDGVKCIVQEMDDIFWTQKEAETKLSDRDTRVIKEYTCLRLKDDTVYFFRDFPCRGNSPRTIGPFKVRIDSQHLG